MIYSLWGIFYLGIEILHDLIYNTFKAIIFLNKQLVTTNLEYNFNILKILLLFPINNLIRAGGFLWVMVTESTKVKFLRENRAEVVKVTRLDYTFDRQIIMEREAGREEGRQAGEDIKAIELIRNAMSSTSKSLEEVCSMLGISTEDMNRYKTMI